VSADRDAVRELAALAGQLRVRGQIRLAWPPAGSGNVADLVVTDAGRVVAYVTLAPAVGGSVPSGDETSTQTAIERRFVDGGRLYGGSDEEWAAVLEAVPWLRAQIEAGA